MLFYKGGLKKQSKLTPPLNKQLQEWVSFRNLKPAHGVLDNPTAEEWSVKTENIIKDCLIVFSSILSITKFETTLLLKEFKNLEISIPLIYDNNIFVIKNISSKKRIWKLKGQLVSLVDAKEFTVDLLENNIFSIEGFESTEKYPYHSFLSNKKEHVLQHNIPIRQTDTFVGRDTELTELKEWIDDEDSRACLIYGDGGYGKTTLVLEFFNKMLEGKFDFQKNPPLIITYYTAKKTKWSEDGLIYLSTTNLAMDECIRELMRCFYPALPKEWYSIRGNKIIDKAKGVLVDNRYERDDILFIIDNTETLASTQEDIKELNDFFNLIRKKLGRVIITSRRRESFEAKLLQIKGLTNAESIRLLKALAKVYNAQSINQAGDRTLQNIAEQLMNKPLLLEALVKYIAHANLGIEKAMDRIFKMSNEQLLEFLYEDAWSRMNNFQKEVFYVMIHLESPLDEKIIGEICQEIRILYSEFIEALVETHFTIEAEYVDTYTLQLIQLAEKFFFLQFQKLDSEKQKNYKEIAKKIDKLAKEIKKVEEEYRTDRVAEAFRSDFAKSAKNSADKGNIKEALELYRLAIEDDPLNSALHDKYSWFLLNRTQEFEYAKKLSIRAIELNDSNCDATVGLALVYYRLDDIENGDKYIDKSNKLGRRLSFCLLRKGIARYHKAKKQYQSIPRIQELYDTESLLSFIKLIDAPIELLDKALNFLEASELKNNKISGYDKKDLKDTSRNLIMTKSLLRTLRTERTKGVSKLRGFGIEL